MAKIFDSDGFVSHMSESCQPEPSLRILNFTRHIICIQALRDLTSSCDIGV